MSSTGVNQAAKGTTASRTPHSGWRAKTLRARQARLAWVFLLPALIVVCAVALWPLVDTVYQSFTNAKLGGVEPTRFVGLKNYTLLLTQDDTFRGSIWMTIKFTIVTVACELALGMGVALVVNSKFRGRGLTRAVMLIPWAIPVVISAEMWKWMFNSVYGVVNDLLVYKLHILASPIAWLAESNTSFAAVCAVNIWKTTPFMALLLLAGLQVIPGDIYEAGRVDGASALRQFTALTLPLLRPAMLIALIFRTLDALRVFDLFYVMLGNGSGTQTMATYAQQYIVSFSSLGYGSAISVVMFAIIAIFVAAYVTILRVETA